MSFPVNLSPSPVHDAFQDIQFEKFDVSDQEKSLLRQCDENVIEYTLADQHEAAAYVQLLLKVLDQATSYGKASSAGPASPHKVSKIPLDAVITDEGTLHQLMYDDNAGIVAHYCVTKLCEVINGLKSVSKKSKVTLASTMYPDGILIDNWRPLLRLLVGSGGAMSDAFAQRGSAYCLACILLEGRRLEDASKLLSPLTSILESFVSWMTSRLQSSASRSISVVTPSLTVLIVDPSTRAMFDGAGGIGYLSRHLKVRQSSIDDDLNSGSIKNNISSGASSQQLYELCYCLWLMSYDCDANERIRNHFYRDGAVPALVDLVAAKPREKVVRLALAALRNLAICRDDAETTTIRDSSANLKRTVVGSTFLQEMVGCGLPKFIGLMREREWSDPDLAEDLDSLHDMLAETLRDMTRWDVYEAEVDSGHLQWSMVHSEKFFKENAKRMEGKDGNFDIVKILRKLAAGSDEDVAAIACYDIGEFVRNYPNGRHIAKRLGVRSVVMGLIESPHPDLQRQALQCVSKMLVQNWQAVG